MRVIAGSAKGMKLICPDTMEIRPTSDRAKEALFNILAWSLPGAKVLDLFAGSGALGIEALSRGSAEVVFVDKQAIAISAISHNLNHTDLEEKAKIIKQDVVDFLSRPNSQFDIIFLDPPYDSNLYETTIEMIDKNGFLHPKGIVVAESASKRQMPTCIGGFSLRDVRHYGRNILSFYQYTID